MPYQLSDSLSIRARNLAFYELVAENSKSSEFVRFRPLTRPFSPEV